MLRIVLLIAAEGEECMYFQGNIAALRWHSKQKAKQLLNKQLQSGFMCIRSLGQSEAPICGVSQALRVRMKNSPQHRHGGDGEASVDAGHGTYIKASRCQPKCSQA